MRASASRHEVRGTQIHALKQHAKHQKHSVTDMALELLERAQIVHINLVRFQAYLATL